MAKQHHISFGFFIIIALIAIGFMGYLLLVQNKEVQAPIGIGQPIRGVPAPVTAPSTLIGNLPPAPIPAEGGGVEQPRGTTTTSKPEKRLTRSVCELYCSCPTAPDYFTSRGVSMNEIRDSTFCDDCYEARESCYRQLLRIANINQKCTDKCRELYPEAMKDHAGVIKIYTTPEKGCQDVGPC